MLLPIVGRKQLVELFAPKMFEALISHLMCKSEYRPSGTGAGSACGLGLQLSPKALIKEMIVFKSEACAAFIYASTRRFPLGQWKCW